MADDSRSTCRKLSKKRIAVLMLVVCCVAWVTLFTVTFLNTPRQLSLDEWTGWKQYDHAVYLHKTPEGYVLNEMEYLPTLESIRISLSTQIHYYLWLTDSSYLIHQSATLTGLPTDSDIDMEWLEDQIAEIMLEDGNTPGRYEFVNDTEMEAWIYDEKELELIEGAVIRNAAMRATRQAIVYPIVILVFPLVLLMCTMRVGRRERWLRAGCCSDCGYDLKGLSDYKCPECGTQHDPQIVEAYSAMRHRRNTKKKNKGLEREEDL